MILILKADRRVLGVQNTDKLMLGSKLWLKVFLWKYSVLIKLKTIRFSKILGYMFNIFISGLTLLVQEHDNTT